MQITCSKQSVRYTPLVEVNQAIFAWSFRQVGSGQATYQNVQSNTGSLANKPNLMKEAYLSPKISETKA